MDKYRLLVVDDLEKWFETAKEILSDQFEIEKATNLLEAKSKIHEKDAPYHVVLSDIRLEDGDPNNIDGVKVAEYVKNLCGDATRVIMWTAYASVETAIKTLKLYAIDYFEKSPVNRNGKRLYFDDRREEFKNRIIEAAEQAASTQWQKERLSKEKKWEKELLVVGKDSEWKNTLCSIMENHGYRAILASSYDEGKKETLQKNFRALLVDLDIGEIIDDGFQFIQWVKATSPETGLLLFSEKQDGKIVREAFTNYKARDFFFKPDFSARELIECIKPIYLADDQLFFIAGLRRQSSDKEFGALVKNRDKLNTDETYEIVLMADRSLNPDDQNISSVFLPKSVNRMTVEIIIYLEQGDDIYDINPDMAVWDFSPNEPSEVVFKLNRTSEISSDVKTIQISVELTGDRGWWRRITTDTYNLSSL